VVEIDPVVTRLAGEYFEYGSTDRPGIEVVHDDVRVFLRGADDAYDVVYLDVFDHLLTVPWTMVTTEALSDMAARLAPNGIFVANVLSPQSGSGTRFLERFRATLDEVFGETRVYTTDPETAAGATQNMIVMAAMDASDLPEADRAETTVQPRGRPLTDMWAPVEYLQARVLAGGFRWN